MMKLKKFFEKIPIILFFMICVSLIVRFFLIFQQIDIVMEKLMGDDLFYYHSIARNIVEGKGIVFNEGINTNGFHPLYLLILIPIHLITPNDLNIAIYYSMVLTSVFSAITSLYIFKIVREIINTLTGLFASALWLFSPSMIFLSLVGMEGNLQVFFISILFYFILKWGRNINYNPLHSIIIGSLCGIIFLSRMDGVFISIAILLVLISRKVYHLSSFKTIFKIYIMDLLLISIFAFLFALPWILWSIIACNSFLPISSMAVQLYRGNPSKLKVFNNMLLDTLSFFGGYRILNYQPILIVIPAFIIILSFLILIFLDRKFIYKIIAKFDILIVSVIFLYSYYFFYQNFSQWWYFNFAYFIVTISMPIFLYQAIKSLISFILKHKPSKNVINYQIKICYIIIVSLFTCYFAPTFVYAGIIHYKYGNYPIQKNFYYAALWIDKNLPKDAIIGSFNSGAIQYYTKNFDVINLDGVVNYEAYRANEYNSIEDFIFEKQIMYIVDAEYYLRYHNISLDITIKIQEINTGYEKSVNIYKIIQ